jgi:hypothetical protein
MENTPAHFPAWPGDAEVAVALTFDVDGEAPWLSEGPEYTRRLTMLSQGRFGPGRGLGRILGLLAELGRASGRHRVGPRPRRRAGEAAGHLRRASRLAARQPGRRAHGRPRGGAGGC